MKRVTKGFDILRIGRHGAIAFVNIVEIRIKFHIFGIYIIKEQLINFEPNFTCSEEMTKFDVMLENFLLVVAKSICFKWCNQNQVLKC